MEQSNTVVIDSSVFVALYRPNDVQHHLAKTVMEDVAAYTLLVHPYVVQEVATVLSYSDGYERAAAFLSDLQNASNVHITPTQPIPEITFFLNTKKKISFTDTTLIQLARDNKSRLVRFDKQMLRVAKQVRVAS